MRIKTTWVVIALMLTGVVGWLDLLTGYEFSFSLFYLVPIGLASWRSGRVGGILISVAGAATWLLVESVLHSHSMFEWVAARLPMVSETVKLGPAYSNPLTPVWNAIVRLAFFVIFALLLTGGRKEPPRDLPRGRSA